MYEQEMLAHGFVFLAGWPGVMPTLHRHEEVEINLVIQGEMTYLVGGTRVQLQAGRLAAFWATVPHRVTHLLDDTRFYCIHVPLARFLGWQLPPEFTNILLHGQMVCESDTSWSSRDLALFAQWREDMEDATTDVCRTLLLELEARMRRLAAHVGARHGLGRPTDSTSPCDQVADKVERMVAYISDHYCEPIASADIGQAVGLHPKYAMSLFRQQCGMTLTEYIVQYRLSQAQRLLATTDGNVVDIAFEAGFGSASQFYEHFVRFCGQSPREFRMKQR